MEKNHLFSNWKKEAVYVTRYAGSGLINTAVSFVVILSAMALNFSPMISNILGYAVGFTMGFVLSKKFVFRSNGHFVTESVRYMLAFLTSFLVNLLVLHLALRYFSFNAVTAQVLAAASYTLLMYVLTRLLVFKTVPVKA